MKTPLISVVVPIYKVEAYLDRCVQSLLDQTYSNLEIILVDDGSPDNCGVLCDEWAKKDPRIRVVHKKNGGLSDARNAGMAVATGELIGFIDGDDYVSPTMYQVLYDRLTADNSDIAACGLQMVWEDETPPCPLTVSGSCVLNAAEAMEAVLSESWLKQPVCYKLYKTALVKDLPFAVGKYHEDVFWTWQAVARANTVSVTDEIGYFYVQHGGSIMAERYSLRRLDALEAKRERLAFLESAYPALVSRARKDILFTCLYQGQQASRDLTGKEKREALACLKQIFTETGTNGVVMPLSHRVWVCLARMNFPLCCAIRNALGIGR